MLKKTFSVLLLLSPLCLTGFEAHSAVDSPACYQKILEDLGWKIAPSETLTETVTISPEVCNRNSLEEIQTSNDLALSYPNSQTQPSLDFLKKAIFSSQSICAFKAKVAVAAPRAAEKLQANANYTFSTPTTFCALPTPEWTMKQPQGALWASNQSCSNAIEATYSRACTTECAVGLQLAHWATLYETFGQQKFDLAFNHLAVGDWGSLRQDGLTGLSLFGIGSNETEDPSDLKEYIQAGKLNLIGLGGALANVKGEEALDNLSDRNENLLITQMSDAAFKQLKGMGSIKEVNRLMEALWNLSNLLDSRAKTQLNQYLLGENLYVGDENAVATVENLTPLIGKETAEAFLWMRKILNQPVLKEILVFVHPLGQQTLSWHLARQLRMNPRTNYELIFYEDEMRTSTFKRYLYALSATHPECAE